MYATFHIFHIPLYSGSKKRFFRIIDMWLKHTRKGYICVRDVHGLVECLFHKNVQAAHMHATYVVPDGMPLVWLGRLLGYKTVERIYGPDLFLETNAFCADHNYSVFLYGSMPLVLKKLVKRLHSLFPKLRIVGIYCPPFHTLTAEEERFVAQKINAAQPDLVWVGLSTPKQELWMYKMRPLLDSKLLIGVGAAFDFIAGTKPQAPIWMRNIGLEWVYRLIHEPKRLWWRYVQCIFIFPLLCLSAVGAKFNQSSHSYV